MATKKGRGRPPISSGHRTETLIVKLQLGEKAAFKRAAELSGIGLSAWVRERLRGSAFRELDNVGEVAPFLTEDQSNHGKARTAD